MAKRNYSKMSTNPEVEQTPVSEPETIEEVVAEPVTQEEAIPETVIGVVSGCGKLNVRKAPDINSDVVCEVVLKSELVINPDKSTSNWYSVCTAAGFEGFCMKKFVEIKQ